MTGAKKPFSDPFRYPLIITPDKLVIPSSGHLDVQMKNPTHKPINIYCKLVSYGFNMWHLKDGKEDDEIIHSEYNYEDYKYSWPLEYADKEMNKMFSYELRPGEVFYFRIKYEDQFDGEKEKLYFSELEGYLLIKCEVNIPFKAPGETEFQLTAKKVFPLTADPEKLKIIKENFAEHQKKRKRMARVRKIELKEDEPPSHYECECHLETDNREHGDLFREEIEGRNRKVFEKYGSKIDSFTDEEIKKLKEGYTEEVRKEVERKHISYTYMSLKKTRQKSEKGKTEVVEDKKESVRKEAKEEKKEEKKK
uniref:Major sperm protein n=1 Tax=Caenorhabditis tropicalis TaxID=1561998 RepID=A0A1I7UPI3_9PELO